MNFKELIDLLLAKISYSFYKHNADTSAHDLNNKLQKNLQIFQCSTNDLIYYADEQGMLNTYTVGTGTKEQFHNDIEDYLINNWGVSSSDYDFGLFVGGYISEQNNYQIANDSCLIYYIDDVWSSGTVIYAYDYSNSSVIEIDKKHDPITITATLENGTTKTYIVYGEEINKTDSSTEDNGNIQEAEIES